VGCLLVLISLITPRLVLFVMWIADYTSRAYGSWLWPTLGFFFAPTTTVAYAIATNELQRGGEISLGGVIVVVIGVAIDLGLIGGGARARKRRWRKRMT
jgi:hypothetical protein